jgi:hypothetical protein
MNATKKKKLLDILDRISKTTDPDVKTFSKVFKDALTEDYYNDPVREETALKFFILALAGILISTVLLVIFK